MNGKNFFMLKIRTMIVGADQSGVSSTKTDDNRITPVGSFIRKFKIDELMQLINILKGEMNFVGPRANTVEATKKYSDEEVKLLKSLPGITDLSSIIFSDEGSILEGSDDPDGDYDALIRPWKSRISIFYLSNRNNFFDIYIIFLTLINIFHRKTALFLICKFLEFLKSDKKIVLIASRKEKLIPSEPPGNNWTI